MKNFFVSYDIALKLKELGFNEKCITSYDCEQLNIDNVVLEDYYLIMNSKVAEWCVSAPTYQQVIDWFRTKYDIFISIDVECDHEFNVYIPYLYQYTVLHKDKTIIISKSSHYNYYTNLDSAIIETINFIWNQSL